MYIHKFIDVYIQVHRCIYTSCALDVYTQVHRCIYTSCALDVYTYTFDASTKDALDVYASTIFIDVYTQHCTYNVMVDQLSMCIDVYASTITLYVQCASVCTDQYMCLCILKEEWLVGPYMYMHRCICIHIYACIHVYTDVCASTITLYVQCAVNAECFTDTHLSAMHIHVYACIDVNDCMYIHVYASTSHSSFNIHKHIYVSIHTLVHVCTYTYINIHIYIPVYVHIYIYVYMYIYVYTYIHIYIYTHIYAWVFVRVCVYVRVCLCVVNQPLLLQYT